MKLVIACLLAYVIGSIPPLRPPKTPFHIHDAAFRTLPARDIIFAFILDVGKGALAVIVAWMIAGMAGAHLAVICVVMGEKYPCIPVYRSRNGWAVATGALLVISPLLILICLCIYLLALLLTRTFHFSFIIALLAFFIGLVLFAAQIYLWLLVIGLIGLLSMHQFKRFRKHINIRKWKR